MNEAQIRPSTAERARTVLSHALTADVEIGPHVSEVVDVIGVDTDGSLVMLVGVNGPLAERVAEHAAPCAIHAALVSPVAGPDRLLDQVTVSGHVWLEADAGPALEILLANHPTQAVLRPDASVVLRVMVVRLLVGDEPVDPAAFGRAQADPLAAGSDEFVQHLVRGHAAEVLQLAHLLEPDVVQGMRAVAPVRLDRFGLTFRIDSDAGSTRHRVDFAAALRGPDELPAAMQALQWRAAQVPTCPFSGQSRSRTNPG